MVRKMLSSRLPLPREVEHPPEAEARGLPWGGKGGEEQGHLPIQADTVGPLVEHGLGGAAVLKGGVAAVVEVGRAQAIRVDSKSDRQALSCYQCSCCLRESIAGTADFHLKSTVYIQDLADKKCTQLYRHMVKS